MQSLFETDDGRRTACCNRQDCAAPMIRKKVPHVIVKLWAGKSEQQNTDLAEAITSEVMEILYYGDQLRGI